jgi:hypothetical protein
MPIIEVNPITKEYRLGMLCHLQHLMWDRGALAK